MTWGVLRDLLKGFIILYNIRSSTKKINKQKTGIQKKMHTKTNFHMKILFVSVRRQSTEKFRRKKNK